MLERAAAKRPAWCAVREPPSVLSVPLCPAPLPSPSPSPNPSPSGELGQAVELMDQMHAAGLAASPALYNGLIQAITMHGGAAGDALAVFLGMQCAGVEPTAQTVALLLACLARAGETGHALWLLREAAASRQALPLAAYNSVLTLLAGEGDWKGAVRLCAALTEAGVQPDSATVAAVLAAVRRGGDSDGLAETLAAKFRKAGLLPQLHQDYTLSNGGGAGGGKANSRAPADAPAQQTNGQLDHSEP